MDQKDTKIQEISEFTYNTHTKPIGHQNVWRHMKISSLIFEEVSLREVLSP